MDITGCRNGDEVGLRGDTFNVGHSGRSKGTGHRTWEDGCLGYGSAHRKRRRFRSQTWVFFQEFKERKLSPPFSILSLGKQRED